MNYQRKKKQFCSIGGAIPREGSFAVIGFACQGSKKIEA
jgi:hypothetical protein